MATSLSTGSSGKEVATLHEALSRLGFTVAAAEREASRFGRTTGQAVRTFQQQRDLGVTGAVTVATRKALLDATTAAAAGDVPNPYVVTGSVVAFGSPSVGGLALTLVDRNVGGDIVVAQGSTGPAGEYTIEADINLEALKQRMKTVPDLQVQVLVGGVVVARSQVIYQASHTEQIDVGLPAGTTGLVSEYETVLAAISSVYPGPLDQLQENDERQDVTYLARRSGWDARAVAMVSLAAQFGQHHPPIVNPPTPGGGPDVPPIVDQAGIHPAFYYALFRAGMAADPTTLYGVNATTVARVWKQAVSNGLIPSQLASQVTQSLERFQAIAAANLLEKKPLIGPSTFGQLVQVSLGDDRARQQQFADLYTRFGHQPQVMWKQVNDVFGPEIAARLQLDGQLTYLTVNNGPLVEALHAQEAKPALRAPADLPRRGYHDPAAWLSLLDGIDAPAEIDGASDEERKANYAELLAAHVRLSFPTATIGSLVSSGTLRLSEGGDLQAQVGAFLADDTNGFDIGSEPVAAYAARTKADLGEGVISEVTRLQRVYQIAPHNEALVAMLDAGLDSAYAVTSFSRGRFVDEYADAMGGSAAAEMVYARSQTIYGSVLQVALGYLAARSAPDLGGTGSGGLVQPLSGLNDGGSTPAQSTLQDLFGNLDYCACQDCRSITSPSAYMVDLLDSLDVSASDPFMVPQEVLFDRRPDLEVLPLTCENTNVAMPYLDLVNETLEYYVGNKLSLADYPGHNTDGTVSSADLVAAPQFDDDDPAQKAYDALKAAWFPMPLPFDRDLERLRLHLSQLGTSLHDVLRALRVTDDLDAANPADHLSYGWDDILIERLGISRAQRQLLTDSTISLSDLYGFTPAVSDAAAISQLSDLQEYSRRTGVSYDDLVLVLETRFVNPGSALIPLADALSVTATMLQDVHSGALSIPDFVALLPAGLDPADYGGAVLADVATWVNDNYDALMGLITIAVPAASPCDPSTMRLQHLDPTPGAGDLEVVDFVRLLRFVRMWRTLALSISQTDVLICALGEISGATLTPAELDQAFALLLPRSGLAYQVVDLLGLDPEADLDSLLTCSAPMFWNGPDSLYARMFLTPTVIRQDPIFEPDSAGVVFSTAAKLVDHLPTLGAALNLTAAELDVITGPDPGLGYDDTTLLTLDVISAIYRRAWLARTLKLSVIELLHLAADTGIDPFAAPVLDQAHPVSSSLETFARVVQAMTEQNLLPVQALYLLWNDDMSGVSAPDPSVVTSMAATLRASFAAVDAQFGVAADATLDSAKPLMALVLGTTASNRFFGLLDQTLVTAVALAYPHASLPDPVAQAAHGRLTYDDLGKALTYVGYLDPATAAALQAAVAADVDLAPAVAALAAANQATVDGFFSTYDDGTHHLRTLFDAYEGAGAPSAAGNVSMLLTGLLSTLAGLRKQEQALAVATTAAGSDPSFASTLLTDAAILPAAADVTACAVDDFTAMARGGLAEELFLGDDLTKAADSEAMTSSMSYTADNRLPAPKAPATSVAGRWTGYLCAPQDGNYNLAVTADPGSTVTLELDVVDVPMARTTGATFVNQSVIRMRAGELTPMVLTVTELGTTLAVTWESLGTGWQAIPASCLYSATLVHALHTTFVRFLKATALAADLSLSALEIAHLANDPELPLGGGGWLAGLAVDGVAPAPEAADLTAVLGGLLTYARLKVAFSGSRTALLDVMDDIGAVQVNSTPALVSLTGWDQTSLDALLTRLYATTDLTTITDPLATIRRLDEAFAVIGATGVSAPTFAAAATNAPTGPEVVDFQAAVRSRYAEADWLSVVMPINDTLREAQRDALVANILLQKGPDILAALGVAGSVNRVATAEDLFNYFLINVEMEPCMETSRIRHALSSIQLFIERCLRGLEPLVDPQAIDRDEWVWRKRYRVWQANREVFLWPENWLDPSLRDDQSEIFKQTLGQLLQGDLSDDSAAYAYLDYLSNLELLAKLEPLGLYAIPATDGSANDVVHAVARTAGAHRKHYHRRLDGGAWTPWKEIKLSIDDEPVMPYVWKGRLMLFWLQFHKTSAVNSGNVTQSLPSDNSGAAVADRTLGQITSSVGSAAPALALEQINAVLNYSEYYNGKWQPTKTSRLDQPVDLGSRTAGYFSPTQVVLRAWEAPDESDESLYIQVTELWHDPLHDWSSGSSGWWDTAGFVLHNTHSTPLRWVDVDPASLITPSKARALGVWGYETETSYFPNELWAEYGWADLLTWIDGGTSMDEYEGPGWTPVLHGRFPLDVRNSQLDVDDQWGMPFFMSDHRNAFYVTTQASRIWYHQWLGYGIVQQVVGGLQAIDLVQIPQAVLSGPGSPKDPIERTSGLGDPVEAQTLVDKTVGMRAAFATGSTVQFGDKTIGVLGSIAKRPAT
jgi:hypothetical protein